MVYITLIPLQRISSVPEVYKALYETVLECNRHFDTVIRDARASFTSTNAQRALDDWINLVVKASAEIQQAYSKSKAGAPNTLVMYGRATNMLQSFFSKSSSRLERSVRIFCDAN